MNNKALELYVKATTGLHTLARAERGQGTVEYVGIVFIVAAICLAILTAMSSQGAAIAAAIGKAITDAIASIKV